ncbi:MAG: DUF126 domain-containing protein [Candidatus Korarchaeota archaeon]|nr:DUF126 domain-containing protein [Candidatus Korarchaeota archaeon]NIU82045.1 DUF126 domain-containing protein [Candidatus Thorarchaeota archaeon]NIW12464.1 DUF126 domain-containing protein [Candidatus Thorarchaeota archaeon]NIW50679.1 DUF126 domain-containing protein [Candidatus Korarchaeota archaeon]
MSNRRILCRCVVEGKAEGQALVTDQPLCFWGGIDPKTGIIIDRQHELQGQDISGKIFVFPHGKGSVSSSTVFLETARNDKAPKAIVNIKTDPVLAVGGILVKKLYGTSIPIVDSPDRTPTQLIRTGSRVKVNANEGVVVIIKK